MADTKFWKQFDLGFSAYTFDEIEKMSPPARAALDARLQKVVIEWLATEGRVMADQEALENVLQ